VRIDSGDLLSLAREVRRIFDEAGLTDVKIIGSGGLDEYDLAALSEAGAPYDSYGVGTKMGISADAPWLDMAYKLVEHNGRPVLKLSTGRISSPAKKQVFRFVDGQGRLRRDVIGLREENFPGAEPLLKKAMEKGRVIGSSPAPKDIRECFLREFRCLDDCYKTLQNPADYQVELSPRLARFREEIQQQVAREQLNDG
jgi:nicotinate phosphoribosyltransferase